MSITSELGWIVVSSALLVGACADEESRSPVALTTGAGANTSTTVGVGGGGGVVNGGCELGDVRECKVELNENNCFIGEQHCDNGFWGPCDDPRETAD